MSLNRIFEESYQVLWKELHQTYKLNLFSDSERHKIFHLCKLKLFHHDQRLKKSVSEENELRKEQEITKNH